MITIFQSVTKTDKPYPSTVEKILERFKTTDKNGIDQMSDLKKSDYDSKKRSLPVVCFNGQFSNRSESGFQKGSGYMILDFDNVPYSYKDELKENEYIYSIWQSPSKKGFKALVKIPVIERSEEFKKYSLAILDYFKKADQACKDVPRACFFCYDPHLWINENSKVWEKIKKEQEKPRVKVIKSDHKLLGGLLNSIYSAVEGDRHNKILRVSRVAGGYIASNSLDELETEQKLIQAANLVNPFEEAVNVKTVKDGIEHGKKWEIKATKDEHLKLNAIERHGKIYYTIEDVSDQLDELFHHGLQKGQETGFYNLNELYTVKDSTTTYIYGAPYSGKTQVWFEILMNQAEILGNKHLIFSPESGRAKDVFAELIAMHGKKDVYKEFKNQMSERQFQISKTFVGTHFICIDPSDKVLTLQDLFDFATLIEAEYGVKLATVTIDPWNDLFHDMREYGNRQDIYLEATLSKLRENAAATGRHNCIITHVQDQQFVTNSNKQRYYPIPTYREIAGGQAWSRKGMSMISVWRPSKGLINEETGAPFEENESIISIQKSKPKGLGKLGHCSLFYDSKRHRYYEELGGTKYYGRELFEKKIEIQYDYPREWDL